MARLIVKGPHEAQAEIEIDQEEGGATVSCSCGDTWTVPYALEEAIQQADTHVDHNCSNRIPAGQGS